MTCLGSHKSSGQFGGQRTEANGHLAGEKARGRAGGDPWLDDAQGPGAGDGGFPALSRPCLAARAVSLGSGHLPRGPWQGESSACRRRQAGMVRSLPIWGVLGGWLELSSGQRLDSAARAQLGGCEAEP